MALKKDLSNPFAGMEDEVVPIVGLPTIARKRHIGLSTLKLELGNAALDAVSLLVKVMNDDGAPMSQRITAAKEVASLYMKVDKRIEEATIMEQQKRMNALRINKAVDETARYSSGYASANVLVLDVPED